MLSYPHHVVPLAPREDQSCHAADERAWKQVLPSHQAVAVNSDRQVGSASDHNQQNITAVSPPLLLVTHTTSSLDLAENASL